jgi:photosystem II stability/assembly factor-like uncharacterized protein
MRCRRNALLLLAVIAGEGAIAADGWAVGTGATAVKSTNSGANWGTTACPGPSCTTGADLYSVFFLDAKNGWAAGLGATIIRTTTGGTTWLSSNCPGPSCPTGAALKSVYFLNSTTGWAAGSGATVLKTTNGGANWVATGCPGASCPVGADLNAVFFIDANTGFAVGLGATIIKTTNGGTSWTIAGCPGPTCPTGAPLNSVHFATSTTGWAVGSGATVLKTTTGGTSWLISGCPGVSCPTGADLKSVYFIGSSTGWAAGLGATVLRTTNGGSTWTASNCPGPSCPTGAAMNSVFFLDSQTGWAAGSGATILRTTNGGTTWASTNCPGPSCPSGAAFQSIRLVNCSDADGDGYYAPANCGTALDCNDANATIHPGATEVCNTVDDDCDSSIDEGVSLTFYRDADGDGFGNPAVTISACSAPAGYVANNTDCDDSSSQDHPGASEIVANGDDENCDGHELCYRDNDGDGYGTPTAITSANLSCADAGESTVDTDCDDASGQDHPGATEIVGNGDDENCDGQELCYRDLDGDGYGAQTTILSVDIDCADSGESTASTDCNDALAEVHPGAIEICNGRDDDCSGFADDDGLGLDADGDAVANACDNCRSDWNPTQSDSDRDGQGDRCDLNDGFIYMFRENAAFVSWHAEIGYSTWNVYNGNLGVLRSTGVYTQVPGANPLATRQCGISGTSVADPSSPSNGEVGFSLVTGVSAGTENSLGDNSEGALRSNTNPCP